VENSRSSLVCFPFVNISFRCEDICAQVETSSKNHSKIGIFGSAFPRFIICPSLTDRHDIVNLFSCLYVRRYAFRYRSHFGAITLRSINAMAYQRQYIRTHWRTTRRHYSRPCVIGVLSRGHKCDKLRYSLYEFWTGSLRKI